MSKHTPGPWTVSSQFGETEIRLKAWTQGTVAVIPEGNSVRADYTARLIAAAPQMLQALEELVAEADNPVGWDGHPHNETAGFQFARDAIRAALGKV